MRSQGRVIVDGVLVLNLTCTSWFYDSTFGLLLLLMWTSLSRKLQNFNIIVMIIHCAGLCFKCTVSMHGLVPLSWKLCGRAIRPGNEANGHTCSVHCMDQSGTIKLRFVCTTGREVNYTCTLSETHLHFITYKPQTFPALLQGSHDNQHADLLA